MFIGQLETELSSFCSDGYQLCRLLYLFVKVIPTVPLNGQVFPNGMVFLGLDSSQVVVWGWVLTSREFHDLG